MNFMCEHKPAQRRAMRLSSRITAPRWIKQMANPQTDTHAREQTKRDEQARKNGEAARAGVDRLADFRQQATEDAWKSMRGSVEAASQGVQNASDRFARTLGYSGEEGERLAGQSGQNVDAITKCGTVLTQAYQDTSRDWYGLAQRQLQRNLEGLSKLAHCRSVQEFATVQSGLIRESLQHMVEDSRSIAEISLRAVNDASKALAGPAQGNAAVDWRHGHRCMPRVSNLPQRCGSWRKGRTRSRAPAPPTENSRGQSCRMERTNLESRKSPKPKSRGFGKTLPRSSSPLKRHEWRWCLRTQ